MIISTTQWQLRPALGAALSVAVAGLALAGCGSSHHTTAGSAPTTSVAAPGNTTTSSPTTAGSSSTTSTAPNAPTASTGTNSGPAECASGHLAGSLGSAEGAAGTTYYQLELRNTGTASCFVQGYPGVQFLAAGDGRPDGAPAQRATGPAPNVVLQPGRTAYAVLGVADAGNFTSGCLITSEEGLRVYPPDQTAALFVAHQDHGCGNAADHTLSVGPLQASPTP